jgi:Transmembrane secretion effector
MIAPTLTPRQFNGGLMLGSVLWGVVAERFGIPAALVLSAGGLAAASVATLRWTLPSGVPGSWILARALRSLVRDTHGLVWDAVRRMSPRQV